MLRSRQYWKLSRKWHSLRSSKSSWTTFSSIKPILVSRLPNCCKHYLKLKKGNNRILSNLLQHMLAWVLLHLKLSWFKKLKLCWSCEVILVSCIKPLRISCFNHCVTAFRISQEWNIHFVSDSCWVVQLVEHHVRDMPSTKFPRNGHRNEVRGRNQIIRMTTRGVVGWEGVPTPFYTNNVTWTCEIQTIRLKHGWNLTDVLVTRRFALLVKSLQWNRKIQCGNSCRRMFTYIQTIWYSLPFYLAWERRSHNSCFSTTPLMTTTKWSYRGTIRCSMTS